ncbi:MDR family MFS transporter [Nocardia sp. alder85J]|uniref:MDR family MFS transporter n=1 Tax=Nocardia sp. alder85J TaxID=2862949 RepID=UPI001CD7B5CC|nr:MDR family MFS transporter [Nocardia sp. alder85J]MCX4094308.1 MDR family MFS transporter [Nocardia sp. alder85J]
MTHRQIMETLTGLLTGMFVAILSSTIVSNALPRIIADLHAGENAYTWVITATLLAMTVTTPIWGKLSDLVDRKLLVQLSLLIFMAGSLIAGFSVDVGQLIAARAIQGIGAGGISALTQTVLAVMVSPRERGRYSGYNGGVYALGTVVGPLVGGAIVDTSWLGWRWCFFIGIPIAAIAMVVLQKTMHLPSVKRPVRIDWLGTTLVTAAASLLLVWVSFAGEKYAWLSWQTVLMVGGTLVLAVVLVIVELKVREPVLPVRLLRGRTVALAVAASLAVGVSMYVGTTFLSQYFQLARGASPTMAGLETLPMVLGLAFMAVVGGRIITGTGRWKPILVLGSLLALAGVSLLSTARADTPYALLALYMVMLGAGVGMTMQNLVLAVQNQVRIQEMGAASAIVTFMRSLGGAVGVCVLGAVLSTRITHYVNDGLAAIGSHAAGGSGHGLPKLAELPGPVRAVVEAAYGHGVADVFLIDAPLALLTVIAVLFIKEVPLRSSTQATHPAPAATAAHSADTIGSS